MGDIFGAADATDDEYKYLRDDPRHLVTRQFVESLWARFHPFADSGFVNLIAVNFQRRFWEMYLACALQKAGMTIGSADVGPDVRIQTGGGPIWVEAITPTEGNGPDAVPPMSDDGEGCQVPDDQVVLRLRAAIEEKHDVYKRYIAKGMVTPDDPFVIAINGRDIPFHQADDQPSYIVRAVYPFGMHTVTLDRHTAAIVAEGFQYRPEISKLSGSTVSTKVFEDSTYAGISAIIYSCADAWYVPDKLGCDFQFLHNPLATNPIDRGWLKVGLELWATVTELAQKNWSSDSGDNHF